MAFKEYMIKKEPSALDVVASILLYVAAFLVSVAALAFMLRSAFGGMSLLLIVGVFYLAHFLSSRLRREYEYICTDDCIDIDVIMNRSRRKRLISFDMDHTETIASINDSAYKDSLSLPFTKTVDATSGRRDANVYFAVVDKNGLTLIKFEPTYSMLTQMQQYARSKIHIYE